LFEATLLKCGKNGAKRTTFMLKSFCELRTVHVASMETMERTCVRG